MSIKNILLLSICINVFISIYLFLIKDYSFLLNMQASFFSSSLIILATYFTYKNTILRNINDYNQLNEIDEENNEDENLNKVFKNKSYFSYVSLYRIIGYIIFIYILFYFIDNNLFDAIAYIIGASILPASIIFFLSYNFYIQRIKNNV